MMLHGADSFNQVAREQVFDTTRRASTCSRPCRRVVRRRPSFDQSLASFDTSRRDVREHVVDDESLDQSLESFDTSSVTTMSSMFQYATSFNQELCWDTTGVDTSDMFDSCCTCSGCSGTVRDCLAPTVPPTPSQRRSPQATPRRRRSRRDTLADGRAPTAATYVFATKSELQAAVAAWASDATAAQETYGHISTWGTSAITDMSYIFCARIRFHGRYAYPRRLVLRERGHAASPRSRASTSRSTGTRRT